MAAFSLPALGATLVPFVGAFAGTLLTKRNRGWYAGLKKPCFQPPGFIVGKDDIINQLIKFRASFFEQRL